MSDSIDKIYDRNYTAYILLETSIRSMRGSELVEAGKLLLNNLWATLSDVEKHMLSCISMPIYPISIQNLLNKAAALIDADAQEDAEVVLEQLSNIPGPHEFEVIRLQTINSFI